MASAAGSAVAEPGTSALTVAPLHAPLPIIAPRAPLADCANCPLYRPARGRLHACVPGSGPERADVVVVGESPSPDEVLFGRSYIGPAGRKLDELLDGAGLDRADVYVTHAVLCPHRTGKERAGEVPAAALRACQARLFEEIRSRRPKVVIALGGAALRALGAGEKIGDARGRERWIDADSLASTLIKGRRKMDLHRFPFDPDWRDGGVFVLPTYDPGFALYAPDRWPDLVKDFGHLPAVLDLEPGAVRELPEVEVWETTTVETALDAIEVLKRQPVLACDIESRSKDLLLQHGSLLTLAYAFRQNGRITAVVIPNEVLYRGEVMGALRVLHARPFTRFVWWNGKFDAKWYEQHLGFWPRIDGDGMLAHYALDERRGIHGLKERASDDLQAPDYEQDIKQYTGTGDNVDYGRIPHALLVQYTARDVGMTLMLVERYEAQLAKDPRLDWVYRRILLPATNALARMELDGIAVDTAVLDELDGGLRATIDGYVATMRDALGAGESFNPDSQPQLVQALYGPDVRKRYGIDAKTADNLPTLGLPLQLNEDRRPGTGAEVCDKLLQLPDLTPDQRRFVEALRRWRLDGQLHKLYVKKLPLRVAADGRVRTNFNLHTTRTGRLSSSDPTNLQNIPARREEGRRIRRAFVAGEWQGQRTVLVEVDLSQAELRMAAFLSRDPALLEIYREDRDFHHEVGVKILGDADKAKELRPFIKTFNFAMLYGADVPMLTLLLNDTAAEEEARLAREKGQAVALKRWAREEVQGLYDAFWAQFPAFAAWAQERALQAVTEGFVESYFGRKRRFPLVTRAALRDIEKEAINHPVQSTAGDIMTLALAELQPRMARGEPANLGHPVARPLVPVHDSILCEVLPGHEDAVVRMVCETIARLCADHGIDVPVKADAKVGPNWGDLKAYEPTL